VDHFQKCVDVTPYMAYQFIKELRRIHIPYVVAPYEADAQLAFLEKSGICSAIITEDSDLLVFGCRKVNKKTSLFHYPSYIFHAFENNSDIFKPFLYHLKCVYFRSSLKWIRMVKVY